MPVVADIQVWADQLQVVRLPAMDAELAAQSAALIALDAEFTVLSQSLTNQLADHSIRIDIASEDAWNAQEDAFEALSTIYQTGLDARLYTDTRIQQLRDDFDGLLVTWGADLTSSIGTGILGDVNAAISEANIRAQQAAAELEQISADLGLELDDVRSVSDQILDAELPSQRTDLDNLALQQISTKGTLDVMLSGFDHPSIGAGLDAVQADLEESVRPLRNPIFRLPASNWCINPHHNTFNGKIPPDTAWFLTDDPIFGECIELPAATGVKIGPSFSTPFDVDAVYKVTLQCRVVGTDISGAATIRMGAATWGNTTTRTEVSTDVVLTSTASINDILTLNWYITASATKALELDGTVLRLETSSTARRAFFYVDQPNNGTSLRLASMEIRDVTEAIEASDIANAIGGEAYQEVIQAIEDVNAALEANQELLAQSGNWEFAAGWNGWATSTAPTDDPKDMNDVLTGTLLLETDPVFPGAAQFTGPAHLASVMAIPILPDQAFTVRLLAASDVPCDVEVVLTTYNLVGARLGEFVIATGSLTSTAPWQELTATKSGEWGSSATRIRMSLRMLTAGAVVTVGELMIKDVTAVENRARAVTAANEAATSEEDAEEASAQAQASAVVAATARNEAEDHATASSTSATAAAVSATNSSQSATAAAAARLAAETAQSQSQSARDDAVEASADAMGAAAAASQSSALAAQAESDATDAAALAVISRNESVAAADGAAGSAAAAQSSSLLAANVASRGTGVLTNQYCAPEWADWNIPPVRSASTLYAVGQKFDWNLTSTDNAGITIDSSSPAWTGAERANSYRVEVEFTLNSGSLGGSGVLFDYQTSGTTLPSERVTKSLSSMVPGEVVLGQVTLASGDFPLPNGMSQGNLMQLRMYLMANWTSLGGNQGKNITIHRIQIYPATFVEAAIWQQSTAIADLQGNASAGFLIQAQAGGQVSLLSLVAADGSNTVASVAKLAASSIILEGTVFASHVALGSFNNLVPDDRLQDIAGSWFLGSEADGWRFAANLNDESWSVPRGFIYTPPAGHTGTGSPMYSGIFPVTGDASYRVRFQGRSTSGSSEFTVRMRWIDRLGEAFAHTIVYLGALPNTNGASFDAVVIAPAAAVEGRVQYYARDVETMTGDIRWTGAYVQEMNAASLVVDGTIFSQHINTASFATAGLALFGGDLRSANFNLGAGTGWRITQAGVLNIPHAVVNTVHIQGDALYVPYYFSRADVSVNTGRDASNKIVLFDRTIPDFEGGGFIVAFNAIYDSTASVDAFGAAELVIDGSRQSMTRFGIRGVGGADVEAMVPVVLMGTASGNGATNIVLRVWNAHWNSTSYSSNPFALREINLTVSGSRR